MMLRLFAFVLWFAVPIGLSVWVLVFLYRARLRALQRRLVGRENYQENVVSLTERCAVCRKAIVPNADFYRDGKWLHRECSERRGA